MNTAIILILSFVAVLSLKQIFIKYDKIKSDIVLKALAVAFVFIGISRFFLSDYFAEKVTDFADPFHTFLRWGYHIGYAVIPIAVFFNNRLLRNIATCFSLPMAIISAFAFDSTMEYFLKKGAYGFYLNPHFRYFYYSLELIIAIILPLLMQMQYKHVINIKNKKEVLLTIGMIPLIMLQMMPSYIPYTIIREHIIKIGMFSPLHIVWMIIIPILIVVLHNVFKRKSEYEKRTFISFLALAQLIHTMTTFLKGFTYSRLPLQLCNIAAFFFLFALIRKDQKFFNFCYLSTILGAFIAIIIYDVTNTNLVWFWNLHYVYEHTYVVTGPILCVSLGIFKRIDRTAIKSALKYFSIYYLSVFIVGILINIFAGSPDIFLVNFFYMFNPATAVKLIPFAGFTKLIEIDLGATKIYPILMVMVYIIFLAFNVIHYFITAGVYKIIDKTRQKIATTKK